MGLRTKAGWDFTSQMGDFYLHDPHIERLFQLWPLGIPESLSLFSVLFMHVPSLSIDWGLKDATDLAFAWGFAEFFDALGFQILSSDARMLLFILTYAFLPESVY